MSTVAPSAIEQVSAELKDRPDCPKDYIMDGIVGNTAHLAKAKSSGTYHISAQDCGYQYGHLYSLTRPEDEAGGRAHPTYASAWDLHWGAADMILVTNRLIASCKDPNDHRLDGVAEVAGTTNGHSVHAYYNNTKTDDPNNTGGWDDGHLSHNHISFKRDCCYNYDAIKGILDVICGVPLIKELTLDADVKARFDAIDKRLNILDTKLQYGDPTHPEGMQDIGKHLAAISTDLAAVKAAVKA